jgi:hypothetical protein
MKSGNLNFLEHYGPVQACNGIALPLPFIDRDSLYLHEHQICINTVALKTTRKKTIIEELSPKDLQQQTHQSRQSYTRGR